MRFTVSTKPLADALSLAIINANVSEYYKQSCIAQIKASGEYLTVTLNAARLNSVVRMKGTSYGSTETCSILVSSLTFKALVQSFDSSTITFEFINNAVILHAGKSKFTLAATSEYDQDLILPSAVPDSANMIEINTADWNFVKSHQAYALSISYAKPAYTRVYITDGGEVLTGDMDMEMFTHSEKSNLGTTCFLSTSIVNLLTALPEGSKLVENSGNYIISVKTDGYEFTAEMMPESEEDIGSYNYEIIMSIFERNERLGSTFDVGAVYKFLKQSELVPASTTKEPAIHMEISNGNIKLTGDGVECDLDTQNTLETAYSATLPSKLFKDVISNLDEDSAVVYPVTSDDIVKGLIFCTDNMEIALSVAEQQ